MVLLLIGVPAAYAQARLALVVGNSAYAGLPVLKKSGARRRPRFDPAEIHRLRRHHPAGHPAQG